MVDRSHLTKEQEQYERGMKHRPHVVILGAGATVAAIPNGDLNGNKSSCMDGFLDKIGFDYLVKDLKIETQSKNLEDIYSEIFEKALTDKEYLRARENIEKALFDYFSGMVIPNEPTIYDYLLLSLRKKDLIASFNWDPLIIQAGFRVLKQLPTIELPLIVFLHGNVSVYFEKSTNKIRFWPIGQPIDNDLQKSQLLYPVKHKDYKTNSIIKDSWEILKQYLKRAYMVTIFGYSAPKSDLAAIEMMQQAWGDVKKRNLEEIEVVDIKKKDDVYDVWRDFIHTHHFTYANDFFSSTMGKYPRRTIESLFDATMNCIWLNPTRGIQPGTSIESIIKRFNPLFLDEALKNDGLDEALDNPYINSFKFED